MLLTKVVDKKNSFSNVLKKRERIYALEIPEKNQLINRISPSKKFSKVGKLQVQVNSNGNLESE